MTKGLSLEAFQNAGRRRGASCVMGELLRDLPKADRATLNEALADPSIAGRAISRVLVAAGHNIAPNSVSYHRRGDCKCEATS
jgi:hypothetical protein